MAIRNAVGGGVEWLMVAVTKNATPKWIRFPNRSLFGVDSIR